MLRLFCCAFEGLHLVKVLNEEFAEGSKAVDVQCSHEGDFVAVTVESKLSLILLA